MLNELLDQILDRLTTHVGLPNSVGLNMLDEMLA